MAYSVFGCRFILNVSGVVQGVRQVLGDCPLIGASTAAEIADGFLENSGVVGLIGSPYVKACVGLGEAVSKDYRKAVDTALGRAGVEKYFDARQPLHPRLQISQPAA